MAPSIGSHLTLFLKLLSNLVFPLTVITAQAQCSAVLTHIVSVTQVSWTFPGLTTHHSQSAAIRLSFNIHGISLVSFQNQLHQLTTHCQLDVTVIVMQATLPAALSKNHLHDLLVIDPHA